MAEGYLPHSCHPFDKSCKRQPMPWVRLPLSRAHMSGIGARDTKQGSVESLLLRLCGS